MIEKTLNRLNASVVFVGMFIVSNFASAQSVFQISSEPRPSQFIQRNPVIFPKADGRFLLAWEDDRDGTPGYYAQYFDAQGHTIGRNFKILSNEAVAFGPDDEFLVVGHRNEGLPPLETYRGYGELYRISESIRSPFQMTQYYVPADFVGCPAFGSFLGVTPSGYLFGDAFNSDIFIQAYDFHGNQIYSAPDSVIPMYALGFTLAASPTGYYALFWAGSDDFAESLGLYGRFFDSNHQIIADSVFFGDRWDGCDLGYSMRALALSDSLYQLFFTTGDTLWYFTCSQTGRIVRPAQYLTLARPAEVPSNARSHLAKYGISNAVNGVFTVFVTQTYWWSEDGVWRELHQTRRQDFGVDGQMVGDSLIAATRFGPVRSIRKVDEQTFQVPLSTNSDIYLYTLSQLSLEDSVKVNDDSLGANQREPNVIVAPAGRSLVSWRDERGKKARLIDASGAAVGEEFVPTFESGWYFPTGEFLTFWKDRNEQGAALGYRIYSAEWQVIEDRLLVQKENINPRWINATAVVLDEDLFVTLLQDSTELHLVKISRTQGIVIDTLIAAGENPFPMKLMSDADGILWAVWRSTSRWKANVCGFDGNLQKVTHTLTIADLFDSQIAFLNGGVLAYVARVQYVTQGELGYYLELRDAFIDEFPWRRRFANLSARNVSLQALDKDHILTTWEDNKSIQSQSFDRDGNTLTEPISVYTSPVSKNLQAVSRVNGDLVLYVWSEALVSGHGLDIFGTSVRATKLITTRESSVEQNLTIRLHQNYPNPFNPETTIEYELAQPGNVQLTIYNLLGQRVRTLVDTWQPAGSYRVSWDGNGERGASRVASEVYIYELKVGELMTRRKMALLH